MKFKIIKYLISLVVIFFINLTFAFNAFVVQKIKIEGLKKVSKDAVLQEVGVKIGQTLTADKAQQIIKSLYKTNFFKNVQLEREKDTLVITVKEKSIISKLEITGVKSKDPINKILKESHIIEGLIYDPNAIHKAERDIERYYLSKDRYGVKVETKIVDEVRDRVSITFAVYEGEEAKIKQIKIIGNTKFKESVLLKQFSLGKTNFFSWFTKNDRYFKEKLDADLETLRSYYMDHGYINFQIDSTQVSLTVDQKQVYITVSVTEGEQYNFGKINLSGEFILPKQELTKILDLNVKTGNIFSRKLLWNVKKQMEDQLGDIGYSRAEARINYDVNEEQRIVNIEVTIIPNNKVMVRKIIITGNHLTEDFVLRRMFPQLEGTWASTKDIQESKQQILRYGYAAKVDVETHPVAGTLDQVDLEYKIEEQRNVQLHGGINYSGAEGLGYNIGADVKNFLGTGKDVGVLFERNKVSTAYRFNYYDPYFTADGIGFGYDMYYQSNNLSRRSDIFEYSTDNIGGKINWTVPVSFYSQAFFAIGYNHTKLNIPQKSPAEISEFTNKKGFKYSEYSISLGWRYTSLDRYIFPTAGLSQRLTMQYNIPISKLKYYMLNYENNWYKPIFKDYIFHITTDLGFGGRYAKDPYPFFHNFFIGGADSVRGFEERSLGPTDSFGRPIGGNFLINFKPEIIFPVPFKSDWENIRPSVFLDIGQVYNTYSKKHSYVSKEGLRYSAGLCVTINTPLGVPIVLSLAKPLNLKQGDKRETFSFTFAANY